MNKLIGLVIVVVTLLVMVVSIQVDRYIECNKLGGELIRTPFLYKCAKVEVIK